MLAAYRRNVRVVSTNLNLASELLTFKLPEQGAGTVESLVAEENVTIGFGDLRATGGKAVYTPGDGLMRLTGDPAWQADTREGRGDELLLDSVSLRMQVNGGASLKLPVSGSGFIPQRVDAVETTAETNRFVTLTAERYELQTNRASFTGGVRVVEWAGEQVRASLTCGSLRSTFGASNQVQDFIAEQHVVLEQDERRLTGQRMNYDGAKGVAQLTGQPTWRDGERSGAGEVLLANLAGDQFIVRGGASLNMPGANDDQLLGALAIRPDPSRDGSAKTNDTAPATPVKITCEEYELSPERAVFRGDVRVDDAQMQLTCDLLTVTLAPGGTNVLDIVADRNVVMSLVETNGQLTTATCARAVYTAATGQIELSTQPKVRRPDGSWFVAERIVMDRATGNLSAQGSYRGSLTSPGGETNAPALLFERRPQTRPPRTSSP
jgi:lipopolysaccharide export system protein LptA